MATIKYLESRITKLETTRAALFAQKEPIDKALLKTWDKLQKAKEDLAILKLKEIEERQEIDWVFLLKETGSSPMTTYKALQKAAEPYSMYVSGYFPETQQRCLQLKLYKKNPERTALVKLGIETITPYYKPNKDGWVIWNIFEHTLSEGGIYRLLVKPDLSSAELQITRFYHTTSILDGPLDKMLEYIQEHHYYTKKYKG